MLEIVSNTQILFVWINLLLSRYSLQDKSIPFNQPTIFTILTMWKLLNYHKRLGNKKIDRIIWADLTPLAETINWNTLFGGGINQHFKDNQRLLENKIYLKLPQIAQGVSEIYSGKENGDRQVDVLRLFDLNMRQQNISDDHKFIHCYNPHLTKWLGAVWL